MPLAQAGRTPGEVLGIGLSVPGPVDAASGRVVNPPIMTGRHVKRAAGIVGTAISDIVNILNPRKVVIGGQLAAIDDVLFAGVRQSVYGRSLPLATRNLSIVPSALDDRAGVHGLTRLVIDTVLAPDRIDDLVRGRPLHPAQQGPPYVLSCGICGRCR